MRYVIFDYVENAEGGIQYPDDANLFQDTKETRYYGTRQIWGKYHGSDALIPSFDPKVLGTPLGSRSVYTKVQFLDKMPRTLRQQIQLEADARTPEVVDWVFIVNAMLVVDLNKLPQGFVDGLEDMVANPNISLTMAQVDSFLEREHAL